MTYTAARLAIVNLQHDRNTLTVGCQLFSQLSTKTLAEILKQIIKQKNVDNTREERQIWLILRENDILIKQNNLSN